MSKKEEILQMYFEEHKRQEIIAETIGVSQSYISQVVKKDTRYTKEKEIRHNKSMQKKAEYNREYYKNYERPKKDDNSYEQLKALLNKDNAELSFHNNTISDYDFAKLFNLPIIQVLDGGDISEKAWEEDGLHINSDFLNGLNKEDAMNSALETSGSNYRFTEGAGDEPLILTK